MAVDFDAGKESLSRTEFINVAKRVIEQQKALQEGIRDSIETKVRTRIQGELSQALKQLDEAEAGIVEKDTDIERLKRQVEDNSALIRSMEVTRHRLEEKVETIVKWIVRIGGVLCFFWVLDTVFSATSVLENLLRDISRGSLSVSMGWVREALNKFAAAVLTVLTLLGFSLTGLQKSLERRVTKWLMNFIYE